MAPAPYLTALMSAVLLLGVGGCASSVAWEVPLWPLPTTANGFQLPPSSVPPVRVGEILLVNPLAVGPLFAVNMSSKTLMWGQPFSGITYVTAVPASNAVVVTTETWTLGFDLHTGESLWANDLVNAVASPIVSRNLVIFANLNPQDGNNTVGIPMGIIALDARTGRVAYNAFNTSWLANSVAVSDTKGGFLNSLTGEFVVFDLPTGALLWAVGSDTGLFPALEFVAAGDDRVVLANTTTATNGSTDRQLVVLDGNTGRVLTRVPNITGSRLNPNTARIAAGMLYTFVAAPTAAVLAIDLRSGKVRWSAPFSDGYAFVTAVFTPKHLVALNFSLVVPGPPLLTIARLSDGAVVTQQIVQTTLTGTIVATHDAAVIPNPQGFVAFSLATGQVLYQTATEPQYGGANMFAVDGELAAATATAVVGLAL